MLIEFEKKNTMIEQLPQRTTLMSTTTKFTIDPHLSFSTFKISSFFNFQITSIEDYIHLRLSAIDGIKRLIQKQTHRPTGVDPCWTILIQRRVIPEQRQEIDDHECEAR